MSAGEVKAQLTDARALFSEAPVAETKENIVAANISTAIIKIAEGLHELRTLHTEMDGFTATAKTVEAKATEGTSRVRDTVGNSAAHPLLQEAITSGELLAQTGRTTAEGFTILQSMIGGLISRMDGYQDDLHVYSTVRVTTAQQVEQMPAAQGTAMTAIDTFTQPL